MRSMVIQDSTAYLCTEVRLASLFSGGFITMTVINPPERKLAKHTSVHCFMGHLGRTACNVNFISVQTSQESIKYTKGKE